MSIMQKTLSKHFHHRIHRARQWALRLAETHPTLHLSLVFAAAMLGMLALMAPVFGAAALTIHLIQGVLEGGGLSLGQLPEFGVLAILAWGGLWIARLRFPQPEGVLISRELAPHLYQWVDKQRLELHASPVQHIYLQEATGVRMMRSPSGGLPLTFINNLVIGVPELQCCTEQQLRGLVAGCLGEISIHNTGVVGWLSHLRSIWMQYHRVFSESRHPFARFGQWFFHYHARAYAQLVTPLGGNRSLQRDQYAHLVVDEDLLAESLAMEIIVNCFLEDYYWPQVFRSAAQTPKPTFKAYSNMGVVFGLRIKQQNPIQWVRKAFARPTDSVAGPTLKQRLQAIGMSEIRMPELGGVSAADSLLGDQQRQIWSQFDRHWQTEVAEQWRTRFEQAETDRNRLQELEERIMQSGLSGKQAMEYAALTKRYGSPEQAAEAYEKILVMNPEDPRINFGVGKFFLKQGDDRGVALLEKAMKMDKHCVPAACRLLSEYRVRGTDSSDNPVPTTIDDWLRAM